MSAPNDTQQRDAQRLERWYGLLLRAYPAHYRRRQADVMLGTLMELARPGQRRPQPREVRALLCGGVQVRAGVDRQRSRADVWRGGAVIAALLFGRYRSACLLGVMAVVVPLVGTAMPVDALVYRDPDALSIVLINNGPLIAAVALMTALLGRSTVRVAGRRGRSPLARRSRSLTCRYR